MSTERTLAWLAASLATTPTLALWGIAAAAHPRLRPHWSARFGFEAVPVAPGAVWIHGASVGEIGAAASLVEAIEGPVLLTADTDTGVARAQAIARAVGARVQAAPRPVDHWFTIAPLWSRAQPRGLIFIEGAWWPTLASMARRHEVPVLRVSAKAGARTRRYARPWWYSRWTRQADLIVARDSLEAAWFGAHSDCPVVVGSDLKYAQPSCSSPLSWGRDFVVFASTRKRDEALVVAAIERLHRERSVLVAPRRMERVRPLLDALRRRGLGVVLRSEISHGSADQNAGVVVLDTLGELASCLVGASACFVGGTFDQSIGGHSPIEAVNAGVPVIAGPHTRSNRQAFLVAKVKTVHTSAELAAALLKPGLAPSRVPQVSTLELVRGSLAAKPSRGASPRPWALPIVPLWASMGVVRSMLHDWKAKDLRQPTIPVVCIGSANARGPGKSSVAAWFARALREKRLKVGVIAHGYRAGLGRRVRLSTEDKRASYLGDEGALFAYHGFLVAASANRVLAARALEEAGVEVIVMDDGLQQGLLKSTLRVSVTDDRFPRAHGVIPAGYRRSWSVEPADIDVTVHMHGPRVGVYGVHDWGPWRQGKDLRPLPTNVKGVAFSAVARPGDFLLELDGLVEDARCFPDHHHLNDQEWEDLLSWADGRPLICTAKDWVRLTGVQRAVVFWRERTVIVRNLDDTLLTGLASRRGEVGLGQASY